MPNPPAAVDPQVLTAFQEELARAATLPGLAPAGPALWPRFAGYYQGLTRLPRRLRRALQRRWRRSLGGICPPLRAWPGSGLGGDHLRRWHELHP